MSDNKFFADILNKKYQKATEKFESGKYTPDDILTIILQHQTNHITHLDKQLKSEIQIINTKLDQNYLAINTQIDNMAWLILGGVAALLTIYSFLAKKIRPGPINTA